MEVELTKPITITFWHGIVQENMQKTLYEIVDIQSTFLKLPIHCLIQCNIRILWNLEIKVIWLISCLLIRSNIIQGNGIIVLIVRCLFQKLGNDGFIHADPGYTVLF